jgi:Zn2+/Cd2+-exporting ATPase
MKGPMDSVDGAGIATAAPADVASIAPARCTLTVTGMDCAGCAETVEKALRRVAGVSAAQAEVVGGKVRVEYAAGRVEWRELAGAVRRLGYGVAEDGPEAGRAAAAGASAAGAWAAASWEGSVAARASSWWAARGRLVLVVAAGVLWAGSLAAGLVWGGGGVSAGLAIGAIVVGGRYIVPRGLEAARSRSLDMNFLMSLAAFGALVIGEYQEAATAMFLFALAQLLEARSMDRARHAVRALMELSPAEATVMRGGREARVAASSVAAGEVVVVRPGEKIPVDGRVLAGRSAVDQAPITGESIPVDRAAGDEVFAGTLNGEGVLEVESTRAWSDTTLARIIHAVAEAQATRAPSQAFVDRFARVYTPAVVGLAAAVMVLPPLAGLGAWGEWFYRALVLLVVACPCALVISTPVTIVSALAGAAREGILIKGGLHLENAGRARVVALDKTGTLTEGRPEVVEVVGLNGASPGEVLRLAASAEARSEHPLARAVVRRATAEGIAASPAAETTALPGRGVRARVAGRTVYVGQARFFAELGSDDGPAAAILDRYGQDGRTAVLVGATSGGADDDAPPEVLGVIAIADRVRAHAPAALRALHDAGIRRVVMLTGDHRGTAEAVARQLGGAAGPGDGAGARSPGDGADARRPGDGAGARAPGRGVDEVLAELLPEDKVAAVRRLRAEHGTVLFVGDGVNDAPALAAADVGVAMGAAGTDVALETADIALMADDLSRLPVAIRLARKAEGIIRANIVFALLTKAVFVGLAVLGVATLWMAVFADMGASLAVIGNGLRARTTNCELRTTNYEYGLAVGEAGGGVVRPASAAGSPAARPNDTVSRPGAPSS